MTDFICQAQAARKASYDWALANRSQKDQALMAMADQLLESSAAIIEANQRDVAAGQASGLSESLIDRLSLDQARLSAMATGLRQVASLADPVGQVLRGWRLDNGANVEQVRVPFGVIGIIYEARPNVTADAAAICLKSGNAALLRGSSTAIHSNRRIISSLRAGLVVAGADPDLLALVEGDHQVTSQMMRARGLIDLLIPRGGAGLIKSVVEQATVPVIETGTGNCHLFIDADADVEMAWSIIVNAKTQRPSVCNALETLLIDQSVAPKILPMLVDRLSQLGVDLQGDQAAHDLCPQLNLVPDDGWDEESLRLHLRIGLADGLESAIAFIRQHGSGHSETIVTNDLTHQRRFTAAIDAACVLVNCSSRFVDGSEFGFGAEIGISTQKLHARGPMALSEMTSSKYVIQGSGQTRR
ncbi:MAG: glutamate-5-semialdehyde dehydrogenase [Propionibacteriaceae bacterium]|jgi:glutamate-5-semialdehyde dehydrogenase|nr:glutamate-5-semialdehyde dehydrogenase [Propionibacteriaceae bacterium]